MKEIKFGSTVVCTNVYDAEGRLYRQITPEDPNRIEYRYDSLGRLIRIDGTVKVRIGYDSLKNPSTSPLKGLCLT